MALPVSPPRPAPRPAPPRPAAVAATLDLLDGSTVSGKLTRFTPAATDLVLEGGEGGRSRLIPAERVACVRFQSRPSGVAPPRAGKRLRVHLPGDKTYL